MIDKEGINLNLSGKPINLLSVALNSARCSNKPRLLISYSHCYKRTFFSQKKITASLLCETFNFFRPFNDLISPNS